MGLLDVVPTRAGAESILTHRLASWGPNMLIDVAMKLEMKSFLGIRECQGMMDNWCGAAASSMPPL